MKRGLVDRAAFPPQEVAEVKVIACELPIRHERPLSRFSRAELHRLVLERGVTEASASTIWRWLHEDAIKPWQTRSSHAGKTSIARMRQAHENAELIHLPVHASWLNQVELFFSIVQRKALTPNDLATLPELARRLMDFAQHYRNIARPFEWTFTREKLDRVLAKITTQPQPQPQPLQIAA